ncbi:hypothetical protein F4776DRAFT_664288 [Hypoxylon sp. NC0597]|nr:hypothetical protein F4776DRAFT_664288 [Hypoxylon sp. NC0597]
MSVAIPYTAFIGRTPYDSEHVLKFQFLQQLLAHLDLFLGPFNHPNPAVTRKPSFYQLILEHNINTPAKGKAWAFAGEMIKYMRYVIGSRMYHDDIYIREILRRQKDRPLGLKVECDSSMKGKFALVQTKTMKINEFLPSLHEQWADEGNEHVAVIHPRDDANMQANKQELQGLIDKIDAMDSVVKPLPA